VGVVLVAPYAVDFLENPLWVRSGLFAVGLLIVGLLGYARSPIRISVNPEKQSEEEGENMEAD
jgi:hypothetical protein